MKTATAPTYADNAPHQRVPISNVRTDGGTQPRAELNQFVIDEYAEAMRQGVVFPPVVLFYDGTDYWLADGFHRLAAIKQNGGGEGVDADVRQGTRRDAILFSVGANASHGLPRTNADKRRAVETLLADEEWFQWSDSEIGRRCAVSHTFVAKLRESSLETLQVSEARTYRTKHGTVATMATANIGTTQKLAPEARELVKQIDLVEDKAELGRLAKLDATQQVVVAQRIAEGEARNVKDALRQLDRAEKKQVTLVEAVQGKYAVVYADPPWQYSNSGFDGAAEDHYPTMATDDICAMEVRDRLCSNAVCFLWVTNPLLEDGLRVLKAWGFDYKTNMVWVKDRGTYLGFYVNGFHELLLIGTRGGMVPERSTIPSSVLQAKRTQHSRKPDDMYEIIERMYPQGPYLELFARRSRPGWQAFGNE